MRYIPNIRMKKLIKPTEIHREESQDNSDGQACVELPEEEKVAELKAVVSNDSDRVVDQDSRGELLKTCFTDMQVN